MGKHILGGSELLLICARHVHRQRAAAGQGGQLLASAKAPGAQSLLVSGQCHEVLTVQPLMVFPLWLPCFLCSSFASQMRKEIVN